MKILVTGATGFVGSHSAAALVRAGHDVRLLVRSTEKARRTFAALDTGLPETVKGDVTDPTSVAEALDGCHAVLHSAALVALGARQTGEIERTNLVGTRNVLGEAHRRGLGPLVYVSSVAALFDPDAGPIGPASVPVFQVGSPYAESKARTERYVRGLQDEGAPVAITYPSGVLGPCAPSLTELHRSLSLQLRMGLAIEGGVSFVDVRDLAVVHAALFARPPVQARFVAAGPDLSWGEVCDLLANVTERRIPRLRVPGSVLRAAGRLGDAAKRVVSFDFPLTYEAMTTATRWPGVDSSATTRELGVRFRDPHETFVDTLRWMCEAGHLAPAQVGRLAGPRIREA